MGEERGREQCWGPCCPLAQGVAEAQVEDVIYFEMTSDGTDCVLSAVTLQGQSPWGVTS